MKKLLCFLILGCMTIAGYGQNPTPVTAKTLTLPLLNAPVAPASGSATVLGNPGPATYYFWVVATSLAGNASPAGPFTAVRAPNQISAQDQVFVSWASTGAQSYDLLMTSTTAMPSGACSCAIATAITNSYYSVASSSTSAYTVNTLNPATLSLTLQNQASAAGQAELSALWGGSQAWSVDSTGAATYQAVNAAKTNGIINAAQYPGVVSSTQTTTGSIASGSHLLTLAAAEDFKTGDGIIVVGAGAANTLTAPATPTVTAVGSPAATTTCEYSVAALDSDMGITAASTPTAAEDCGGVGASTNNIISTYNTLTWTPVTGAEGYVIYEKVGAAAWQVAQIPSIPASDSWWTSGTVYNLDTIVQPRGPQYNGWTYEATTAGTSGSTQPTWCTTSGCTVTDGGVTWTAEQDTFNDDGRNWAWFAITAYSWIPATPPASAIADALVTTVSSGGGTTSLTLATAATTAATSMYVGHDATAGIQAAATAQNASCISVQPSPGLQYYGTCESMQIPAGIYMISSTINVASEYGSIYGTHQSVLQQINPVANVINLSNLYQNNISGLTILGGKTQIQGTNCGTDNTKANMHDLVLEQSQGYALAFFNDCLTADDHLSSSVTLNGSKLIGDSGDLYYFGDRFSWNSNWTEMTSPYNSLMWGRSEFVFPELGGEVHSSNSEYIPEFSSPGGSIGGAPSMSWVDDYWDYFSTDDRFSGEGGGGVSCVNYSGGVPGIVPSSGIVEGGNISLQNDWLFCSGLNGNGKIHLTYGLPQSIIIKNDYGYTEPLISNSSSNNINVGLLPIMQTGINPTPQYSSIGAINIQISPNDGMAACNVIWNSQVLQYPSKGYLFPASLIPYITTPECRQLNTIPTDGFWGVNEKLFQVNYAGAVTNRGWINTRQGQAAPAWAASTAYTAGEFVTASPDNQHVFECTTPGISGATQPTWNTTSGGTTADGTVTWTEEGQSALFAPLGPVMTPTGEGEFTASGNNPALSATAFPGQTSDIFDVFAPNGSTIYDGVNSNGVWNMNNGATLSGNLTGNVSGTGAVVLASTLPLTGSVAGSTTLLGANSCGDTVTATVTGATTSMAATATGSGALPSAGLTTVAAVTAANTVSIEYCNVTTAGITPAALTLVIRVIQ